MSIINPLVPTSLGSQHVLIATIFYLCGGLAAAKLLQSCPILCNPIDGSLSGSPVPGILQARKWSGLPCPSPMHESEVAPSDPTLCDPMDCSLPGSSIHGIFQARVLEWGAIAFSGVMALVSAKQLRDGISYCYIHTYNL